MRRFYIGLCLGFLFLFAIFGDASMRGAVKALELFAHGVFPALFPFCVCIGCLKRLGFFDTRGNGGCFALLRLFMLGAMAGNPTGSMLIGGCNQHNGEMSEKDRSVYSALFNLASPAFLIGTVCSRLFALNSAPALLLMLSHYSSALLLFSAYYSLTNKRVKSKRRPENHPQKRDLRYEVLNANSESIVSVFPSALIESVSTMLKLCGTIVFFVSVTELLTSSPLLSMLSMPLRAIAVGLLEMTNGLYMLSVSSIEPRFALSCAGFMLSFGGISIFMQANAVLPVRSRTYLCAKLAHGIFSAILCYMLFPAFRGGSIPVLSDEAERLAHRTLTTIQITLLCSLTSLTASLVSIFAVKRTRF